MAETRGRREKGRRRGGVSLRAVTEVEVAREERSPSSTMTTSWGLYRSLASEKPPHFVWVCCWLQLDLILFSGLDPSSWLAALAARRAGSVSPLDCLSSAWPPAGVRSGSLVPVLREVPTCAVGTQLCLGLAAALLIPLELIADLRSPLLLQLPPSPCLAAVGSVGCRR